MIVSTFNPVGSALKFVEEILRNRDVCPLLDGNDIAATSLPAASTGVE